MIITVLPNLINNNYVQIIGQIKRPGLYYYNEGNDSNNLFDLSSGFNDKSFLKSVNLTRGKIIRRSSGKEYEDIINFNIDEVFFDKKDIILNNFDKVIIHMNPNFIEKQPIFISGEVNIPGSYPLIKDNETLNSMLNRAGGFTEKALLDGISIYRDKKYFQTDFKDTIIEGEIDEMSKKRVAWTNRNIVLMPGDSVIVKEKSGTVNILGEIYNPGLIEYRQNKSLDYYVDSVGGITEDGNSKNIIVVYANGTIVPKKGLSVPKITEGSTIIVKQKPPQEPFNLTVFASSWASIVSSMVTIIVLSQQLNTN